MRSKIVEIIIFLCVSIAAFSIIALGITATELDKAQKIYCFRKYQNDVLNYQKCTTTRFIRVLQEDNQ